MLDGRNRFRACVVANVTPKFELFTGPNEDALAFVASENIRRRHLNASQKAFLALKFEQIIARLIKERENVRKSTTTRPYVRRGEVGVSYSRDVPRKPLVRQGNRPINSSRNHETKKTPIQAYSVSWCLYII